MCKFHKDVARDIATDPATGKFDPAIYSVALVALAKYRIEQYMPSMIGCDGYNKYEMAVPSAVAAMEKSGLQRPAAEIKSYRDAHIDALRKTMVSVAMRHDLSLNGLNLPKDPVRDVAFLDEATVQLFEGYTRPGFAAGEIHITKTAHKPQFEPIRAAAADFLAQDGAEPILRRMFENNMSHLFTQAKESSSPAIIRLYESLPGGLKKQFKTCAMCAGSGASGFLLGHAGCIITPFMLAAAGATAATGAASLLMFGTGALITGAGLFAWWKLRGQYSKPLEKKIVFGSAVSGLVIYAALHLGSGHENHGGSGHDHHGHHATTPELCDPSALTVKPR